MRSLPTASLCQAFRTFLRLAYPDGEESIPAPRRQFLRFTPDHSPESWLAPPLCQVLPGIDGRGQGYSIRLGSARYPHLKLQITDCGEQDRWVFSVDTHDAMKLEPSHPDALGWAALQAANRQLKEAIERAWEAEGLLTFNALLRRGLGPGSS